jgi:tetratricopeptide (TPR) repeat protein
MRKTFLRLFLTTVLFCACSTQTAQLQKKACVPPSWVPVPSPESMTGQYYGIGEAQVGRDQAEARKTAYNRAVSNLALMAGQTISTSFQDFQAEQGKGGKVRQESRIVSEIKIIAIHTLQGIVVKDTWTDACRKTCHILVVLPQKQANEQIARQAQQEKDAELRKVVLGGVARLDKKVAALDLRAEVLEEKYGDLLSRLAQLEATNEKQKATKIEQGQQSPMLADLSKPIQDISRAIAGGAAREDVERSITAAEWLDRGNMNLNKGNYDQAMRAYNQASAIYDQALAIKPGNFTAAEWLDRGNMNLNKGNYDQAIRAYNQAIAIYDQALAIEPGNFTVRMKAAAATSRKIRAKNRKSAAYFYNLRISECTKAISLNPENPDAYITRGLVYFRNDDVDLAIRDYRKACELGSQRACAYVESELARAKQRIFLGEK